MDGFETPVLLKGPVSRVLKRRSEIPSSPKTLRGSSLNVSHSILGFDQQQQHDLSLSHSLLPPEISSRSIISFLDDNNPPGEGSMNGSAAAFLQEGPENLFADFLSTISESSSGFKTLDQVAEFEQLVGDHYEALHRVSAKYAPAQKGLHLDNLRDERNTWRLLGKLYHDRLRTLNTDMMDTGEEEDEELSSNPHSEKLVVNRLFRHNQELREAQAIVDWLEANVADSGVHISAERFSDATISWENTLHSLKHASRKSSVLVNQLDPDAPRRLNKPLHDLDAQDQNMLCDAIFTYIKSGMLDKAQDLCIKLGQPWRAATLEGWKLYHDENYSRAETRIKVPCEGNKTRDLWKRSAWKMTKDERMPAIERAAYSAFCGNVRQLLSVCKSWEDCLWALSRCYIDLSVEKEIRRAIDFGRQWTDLPQEYWDENKASMAEVLEAMESLDNESVKAVRHNAHRVIQCCLISQDYVGLLQRMLEWIQDPQDPHLLRLFSHLIIVFRRLNAHIDDESVGEMENAVLQVYVIYLMSADKAQLIAWYTAQLPTHTQIELYSKFLENVRTFGDRKLCLDLAMESDLPIQDITTQVVINIRTQEEAAIGEEDTTFQPANTERDIRKIDALSWLIFFEEQRDEAIYQANALIRSFIASGKIDSAREALQKIPEDSISLVRRRQKDEVLSGRVGNSLREFLGHQSYLQAQEAFTDWFGHFSKGVPRRPVLNENASFVEKVAFEQREEQYQVEMERWSSAQVIQSRAAVERLMSVLTFPQGWLLDEVSEEVEEGMNESSDASQRTEELEYLRRLLIPKLVILLHSVLHGTKQFKEAIRLGDLVASERYEIYRLYSKDKLRELLIKIQESSVAAMETGSQDPWGFFKK
eukprot:TRINITY_DN7323_c0_g1_i1.p1 TRINITY_DN7323_c0_g1~~TRINITY_DN7323_c0_g1_i1.p1  ORF type:complete len:873 (-),score=260.12 TRINITY_DN7323_c0_g1_i1:73-2691(-)